MSGGMGELNSLIAISMHWWENHSNIPISFSKFWTMWSTWWTLGLVRPEGSPKYIKGRAPSWQFRAIVRSKDLISFYWNGFFVWKLTLSLAERLESCNHWCKCLTGAMSTYILTIVSFVYYPIEYSGDDVNWVGLCKWWFSMALLTKESEGVYS